jgi:hypothetical protein
MWHNPLKSRSTSYSFYPSFLAWHLRSSCFIANLKVNSTQRCSVSHIEATSFPMKETTPWQHCTCERLRLHFSINSKKSQIKIWNACMIHHSLHTRLFRKNKKQTFFNSLITLSCLQFLIYCVFFFSISVNTSLSKALIFCFWYFFLYNEFFIPESTNPCYPWPL